jgi:hypothetical protein
LFKGRHFPSQSIRISRDEPHAKNVDGARADKNYFLGLTVVSSMWLKCNYVVYMQLCGLHGTMWFTWNYVVYINPHYQSTTAHTPLQYIPIIQAKQNKKN